MNTQLETWHGGKVHKIRPYVIHLMGGQIFEIDGKGAFYELVKNRDFEKKMQLLTIQGEFCAPGIQKNPLDMKMLPCSFEHQAKKKRGLYRRLPHNY